MSNSQQTTESLSYMACYPCEIELYITNPGQNSHIKKFSFSMSPPQQVLSHLICAMDGLFLGENGGCKHGRVSRGQPNESDDDTQFKSKNLEAERRRRLKLSQRLLTLRSFVPKITNAITPEPTDHFCADVYGDDSEPTKCFVLFCLCQMNMATILDDAVTYIEELKKNVDALVDQLCKTAASCEDGPKASVDEIDMAQEMEANGIKPDVQVTSINEHKLWIKIIIPKKRSRFTKLLETLSIWGFELTDTSVTAFRGAMLISSCMEGAAGEILKASRTKDLLQEIIKGI